MFSYRKWIKRTQLESLSWIWTCFRSTLCPRGRWVVSVAKDTFWSDENTGPAHGATSMWTKSEWKAHFLIAPQTLYSVHASVSMSPMIPGTVAWEFIVIIQNPRIWNSPCQLHVYWLGFNHPKFSHQMKRSSAGLSNQLFGSSPQSSGEHCSWVHRVLTPNPPSMAVCITDGIGWRVQSTNLRQGRQLSL